MENSDNLNRHAKRNAMEKLLNALEKHPLSQKDFLEKQKGKCPKKGCSLSNLFRWICNSLHIHINH